MVATATANSTTTSKWYIWLGCVYRCFVGHDSQAVVIVVNTEREEELAWELAHTENENNVSLANNIP